MNILVCKNNQTLDEIGKHIYKLYPNIRFLFEIDFSKDDYLLIKELFQKEYLFQDTYFKDDFFLRYFRNNTNNRLPFLILLIGFIRYEYLNSNNQGNFFENFLRNIIQNYKADSKDFRVSLINYFFRWRGKKEYKENGLYIYDMQTSEVSLKLEDSGKNKYLNSFIFHSGGVSEQDLKEYFKIIRFFATKNQNNYSIFELYKNTNFKIYSKKLIKLFNLLNTESEISKYIENFISQSVAIVNNKLTTNESIIPPYIRNYLLFIGRYGEEIGKINISDRDFIYENGSIVFNPYFNEIYRKIGKISFKIDDKKYDLKKEYNHFTEESFNNFKVPLSEFDKIFIIELWIDDNLFRRYDINLFEKGFILLDNDFNVKNIQSREIYIPKRDEEKKYYIISQEILDLSISDKDIDDYFVYELELKVDTTSFFIGTEEYLLYFSPRILSDIQYEDNQSFLYVGELPKFRLSKKDEEKFVAVSLFDEQEFTYESFYNYSQPTGKFKIQINQVTFQVVYIDGFEIKKWFNWYDKNKTIEIQISDKNIKTNHDEVYYEENKSIYIFSLKGVDNQLVFNQINGNNITLEIIKPMVVMSFLDKRKNEIKIKSKNIKFERLNFYRQLKIQLFNYPSKIVFDTFRVGENEIVATKHNNSYFLSIKKLKESIINNRESHLSIVSKNSNYFLPITDIIFEDLLVVREKDRKEIKINDIHFLMNNSESIKYYFDNKPYFIHDFELIETTKYRTEMLVLKEARETKESKVIKKNFRNIKEDGLYVELKDIDYE